MYAEPIKNLIDRFGKLPGIGEKSAERIVFYLIHQAREEAVALASSLKDVYDKLKICSECCNISTLDPCEICSNQKRSRETVCVVEQTKDLWAIERSGTYSGLYHVLHGRISPLDGIHPEDLTIGKLLARVKKGLIREVIIATNPTAEGDVTAYYIHDKLKGTKARLTRIAKGIPEGGTLDYVSTHTVGSALKSRKEFSDA